MNPIAIASFMKNPPSSVSFDGEDKDEHIVLFLRRHFITNVGWILMSVFLFFLPALLSTLLRLNGFDLADYISLRVRFAASIFWYLFVFGVTFENFLLWYFNVYLVTTKRIVDMDFHALLHRDVTEAPLRNVEDITRRTRGALQVIFNYGSVTIQTAGEQRELEFEFVPDPTRVQDIVSDIVAEMKTNGNR